MLHHDKKPSLALGFLLMFELSIGQEYNDDYMSEFLYRPILQELTTVVKSQGLDPYEAYAWLHEQAADKGLRHETYASTSITSGGHARDTGLPDISAVISRNTQSAYMLANQLAVNHQIRPESTIEPVAVGNTGWKQSEFMEFWLAVIAGAELGQKGQVATSVDELRQMNRQMQQQNEVDIATIDSKSSIEQRTPHYFKLAIAAAALYGGRQVRISPARRVVRLVDTAQSLGAQSERVFARQLGVPVMNVGVVAPVSPESLRDVDSALFEDTQRLIRLGATVFDTVSSEVRLCLIEDVAQ